MRSLSKDLKKLLGSDQVFTSPEDLLAYANDGTFYLKRQIPDAVVLPHAAEDVAKVLRYADQHEIPLTPRGAGTGLAGGCTPVKGGIVLDMKRMNAIREINKDNMTASVQAGVVLGNFQKAVERQGLFYPPDPQSMSVCTLGGNVATRAGGPRGVKYGATGHYVLGVNFVLPDGEIIQSGGKFVKQSVGYDLPHLMTGSEGTLGVITDIDLRLLPYPEDNLTLVVVCETLDQAAALVSAIIARGAVPAMMEYVIKLAVSVMNSQFSFKKPIPETGEAYLLVYLDGSTAQVKKEAEVIREVAMDLKVPDVIVEEDKNAAAQYWTARKNFFPMVMSIFKRAIIEDVTVPRNKIPAFVSAVQNIALARSVTIGQAGHVGDGNLHPTLMQLEINPQTTLQAKETIDDLIRAGLELGGTISGEHGIGIHKQEYLEWELGPGQVELMRRIKKAFDPKGIMNPGKIWTA
ncbi:FAD-binding oxidoreductase [Desulfosarcina sp. OttesenSCG-928-A07]|nr:FAD-binding oxidoreductase [Desulfosarcina sp. OttesenSCG-928-G17]MDL2328209.1 FAD-binding oxidoreductase [Desulfosarcina sp. OttesenSCG-928-A07]